MPGASSAALAAHLLGRDTSASAVAVRLERKARVQAAIDALEPVDREVLVLRHFEELTNAEVAHTLEIQEAAASKRYVRALRRLKRRSVRCQAAAWSFDRECTGRRYNA